MPGLSDCLPFNGNDGHKQASCGKTVLFAEERESEREKAREKRAVLI